MKKILIYNTIVILILTSCSTFKELISFTRCEFRMKNIQSIRLAGVDMQGKTSINDFNISDMAVFARYALGNSLPLDMVLLIEAKNPNRQSAALNKIEWIAYLDDMEMMEGIVNERIVVPPDNGTGIIPLHIQLDMKKVMKSSSANAIANLALNMMNIGDKESRLAVKIKPTILIGSVPLDYPGYIKITKNFTSGN